MKRSKSYYLKRLERCVEQLREGESIDFKVMSDDTMKGMVSVFSQYLEYLWLNMGDTAFNKGDYGSITDYLFEQLQQSR